MGRVLSSTAQNYEIRPRWTIAAKISTEFCLEITELLIDVMLDLAGRQIITVQRIDR